MKRMINMIFQDDYFANYFMIFIETLGSLVILFFLVRIISKIFIDRRDDVKKIQNTISIIISIMIAFAIGVILRCIFAYLGWLEGLESLRLVNSIYFTFALMTTVAFPFNMIFLNKISKGDSYLNSSKSKKLFRIRFLALIGITWIVYLIFLSIDILEIPIGSLIPSDYTPPDYDNFFMGFQWAFLFLMIYKIFTKIVITFISIEKRPPKEVLNSAIMAGTLLSFGIWSIQLIIVELYINRLGGIIIYEQDIRVLIVVVLILYIVGILLSMKFRFLPRAIKEDKRLIQEEITQRRDLDKGNVLLDVKDLKTYFYTEEGVVTAVEGVSFKIHEGDVLGLVGETGCGKSVTALSILQLIQSPGKILGGTVEFEGEDLLTKSSSEILNYRGNKITMIFQDPLNSLNPVFTVGKQISEVYLLHKRKELLIEASSPEKRGASIDHVARMWSQQLLKDLNIPAPENILDRYPHELSGGMRQRIQIAMGIACSPQLLIADEPTTALDVTVQNQILKLMKDLKVKHNTSILFITHDLGIISKMCDRVAIMYCGSIVEYGTTKTIFTKPYHPYTKGLLSAIPIEGREDEDLAIIEGMVPNLIYPPSGCRFHPRCPNRFSPCDSVKPRNIELEGHSQVACHLYDPKYNKEEILK